MKEIFNEITGQMEVVNDDYGVLPIVKNDNISSTIILASELKSIVFTSATVITSADSILSAFGKVQAQITGVGSSFIKLDQTTSQTIINGQPIQDTLTASQIVATDVNKKLQTLTVATYPSLTELSYVKGVTSGLQGQINAKQATITTGTTSQYFRGDLSLVTFPSIPAAQIQSDWNQSNNALLDYIKNKPTIPAVQVNSDWNAVSGVAQILNKPTIPTVGTWGVLNYPTWVSGTPFVKMTAAGTFALDTNTYLTSANIDGGNVNSIYLSNQINNGGNA